MISSSKQKYTSAITGSAKKHAPKSQASAKISGKPELRLAAAIDQSG
ncbi:hypothetical protein RUMTOR_00836 [[Ruminococcus] torques ATCC 27756]|uniref:Uncharacterized protein n=1 Tax=[Ruminococcus] torques ATCC 27756 TaxID=411460 RepID=A5KKT4_9FIRM|nr:hypothetical protein RUMTOR_00836 [[Ruminococcus] torques ATCC 27756]